jgi:hypothetical protein
MANNVIYLPPGVTPPPTQMSAQAAVPVQTGIPFDRNFFEAILPQAIQSFCTQAHCDIPRVELLTVDGAKHFVNGISGVSDAWVALTVSEEAHPHAIQVFIPYQTIFRVEVHPEAEPERGHLGFALSEVAEEKPKRLPAQSKTADKKADAPAATRARRTTKAAEPPAS